MNTPTIPDQGPRRKNWSFSAVPTIPDPHLRSPQDQDHHRRDADSLALRYRSVVLRHPNGARFTREGAGLGHRPIGTVAED